MKAVPMKFVANPKTHAQKNMNNLLVKIHVVSGAMWKEFLGKPNENHQS